MPELQIYYEKEKERKHNANGFALLLSTVNERVKGFVSAHFSA